MLGVLEEGAVRRPSKGDRWQHRKTSRVCVVEEIRVMSNTWIGYRYEQRKPNARSTRQQWMTMMHFVGAFSEFEAAA